MTAPGINTGWDLEQCARCGLREYNHTDPDLGEDHPYQPLRERLREIKLTIELPGNPYVELPLDQAGRLGGVYIKRLITASAPVIHTTQLVSDPQLTYPP